MKKKTFIFLTTIITLCIGCLTSDFDEFKKASLDFVSNDKKIDQKEFEDLLEQISLSDDKGFQQFKDNKGQIDNLKVVSYLLKFFISKKNEIAIEDIWQPEFEVTKTKSFNINVFLENSASMDGYVKGVTEFETAIYNLLGDFKISGICDSLNLNYINKSIPYSKQNALAPDIQDFIEKLEPSIFRQRGGDRSVSDLKNVLNTVLKSVNDKNLAVLISDFVFSPGSKANAQDYLNNQGVGIKIDFAEKIKSYDLATVVIQLESNFNGLYYDKSDRPISINSKRPYYIWIIGNTKQVTEILEKKILDNVKGGYKNRLVFQSIKKANNPTYKILSKPTYGSFNRAEISKGVIFEASESKEIQSKGLFGFNLAINFSNCLQESKFYNDTSNYRLSNNSYLLEIETINDQNAATLSGYTHLLKLKTKSLRDENLKIDVIGNLPSWVSTSTSNDDSNILIDDQEKQKTFGFKFLMEGVKDAFYPKSNSNALNSISITIKK
jgi:hypothetical protein